MHGNLWEWCQDDYESDYNLCPDDGRPYLAKSQDEKPSKVLRGGSWLGTPWVCRSACRHNGTRAYIDDYVGFRVVCVASRALP